MRSSNKRPTRSISPSDETTESISEEEWSEAEDVLDDSWTSATSTYNYMMKDPLLDWLKRYHGSLTHKKRKYQKIVHKSIEESKSAYNFTQYIMEQGNIFEKKVMKLITKKFGSTHVAEIHGESGPRDPEKVQETLKAMKKGIPIIHSGVLHNPENKTFGIPDLLIRSDWMKFLVNESPLTRKLEIQSAPKLGKKWHYRVVDIKFTGLLLRADSIHLLNAASFPAYKAQLLIYNWALGHLQGYTPDQVYILGRRWKYTSMGETHVNDTCFDKFGIIDYNGHDSEYIGRTNKALEWLTDIKSEEASTWNITKYPLHRWELYPNMCNSHDYPWHTVKEQIAEDTKELTSLWMVGPKNRNIALDAGICKWTDKKCNPDALGIYGEKTSKILKEIIDINHSKKIKISPQYIKSNIGLWKHSDTIEFFVDFETCNGAISNIKRLPSARTGNIVFMIGVGYINPDSGKWVSKEFTVNSLRVSEEERICRNFSDFIRRKAKQYGVKKPRCIHWAPAEDIMWADAVERHDPISDEWKSWLWDWLDLLAVFKHEPIVINGCMSFGLKHVASAMKDHGFIKTAWDKNSSCVDGQSAMIAAQKAHEISRKSGISMKKVPIMKQIREYNKVDVLVLYEIITYLRDNHISNSDSNDSNSSDSNSNSSDSNSNSSDNESNSSDNESNSSDNESNSSGSNSSDSDSSDSDSSDSDSSDSDSSDSNSSDSNSSDSNSSDSNSSDNDSDSSDSNSSDSNSSDSNSSDSNSSDNDSNSSDSNSSDNDSNSSDSDSSDSNSSDIDFEDTISSVNCGKTIEIKNRTTNKRSHSMIETQEDIPKFKKKKLI